MVVHGPIGIRINGIRRERGQVFVAFATDLVKPSDTGDIGY